MITYVCVEESRRGRGVGEQMVKDVLARFPEKSVYLTVSESNAASRQLYERLDFAVIGEIKNYNFPGESEFIMRRAGLPKRAHVRPPPLPTT